MSQPILVNSDSNQGYFTWDMDISDYPNNNSFPLPNDTSCDGQLHYPQYGYESNPMLQLGNTTTHQPMVYSSSQDSFSSGGTLMSCNSMPPSMSSPTQPSTSFQPNYSLLQQPYDQEQMTSPVSRVGKAEETRKCTYEGCDSTGKFKRYTDLKRHIDTVHAADPNRIDCHHKWCGRVREYGFTRKDHYREHLREMHGERIPKTPRQKKDKGACESESSGSPDSSGGPSRSNAQMAADAIQGNTIAVMQSTNNAWSDFSTAPESYGWLDSEVDASTNLMPSFYSPVQGMRTHRGGRR